MTALYDIIIDDYNITYSSYLKKKLCPKYRSMLNKTLSIILLYSILKINNFYARINEYHITNRYFIVVYSKNQE